MIYLTLGLLGLAAVSGTAAMLKVLKGELPANLVVILHGAFAAAGLIALAVVYFNGNAGVGTSLILYVAAALGGYYLLFKHFKAKAIPKAVSFLHAGTAVVATLILLSYLFL